MKKDYLDNYNELVASANAGDLDSQYELATKLEEDGNYAEALEWFKKCADQGQAEAKNALAMYYLNGMGVAKDEKKAYDLLVSAADELPDAKFNLATLLMDGIGCDKDIVQGFRLIRKAGYDGEGIASYAAGRLYLEGLYSEPVNYDKAIEWFERAAKQEVYEAVEILCDIFSGNYAPSLRNKSKLKYWMKVMDKMNAKTPVDQKQDPDGRWYVENNGEKMYMDEIIATAVIPRPFKEWNKVEHIDGDISNNDITNLRWAKGE